MHGGGGSGGLVVVGGMEMENFFNSFGNFAKKMKSLCIVYLNLVKYLLRLRLIILKKVTFIGTKMMTMMMRLFFSMVSFLSSYQIF